MYRRFLAAAINTELRMQWRSDAHYHVAFQSCENERMGDEMFLNYLKHKSEMLVSNGDSYDTFLTKEKLKSSGIVKKESNDIMVTASKDKYIVYEISYKNPNFVDDMITRRNEENLNDLIKKLTADFKVLYLNKKENSLDENIAYFDYLYQQEQNPKLKRLIADRLNHMMMFNDIKYRTLLIYVNAENQEEFERLAEDVFTIERYTGDKLDSYMRKIGNEVE
ncbi:hypothetical protein MKD14_08775 [[Clostridium] innocuum]|nr:hypothetical protein [[Clostridium] innocuum]